MSQRPEERYAVEAVTRAREWRRSALRQVCDVLEPWSDGTIARSTRHPDFYDYNTIVVERDPALSAGELIDVADRALAGHDHRRIDFELPAVGLRYRAELEARGWKTSCLVMMRHEGARGGCAEAAESASEVPYEAAHHLRLRWHREDFPDADPTSFQMSLREVSLVRQARVLAVHAGGAAVAYAQVEQVGEDAEVTEVFVTPEHRDRGLGTALTRAAIGGAMHVRDLWITADDEGRPKHLYARLGFRPVTRALQFLRLPGDVR